MVVCPECHSPIVLGVRGKTLTRSFRIDEAALAALEEEAEKKNMSVNTFLNQQILSFAEFERFFMRLGIVKFSANTLQRLLESTSEDGVAAAGKTAAQDTPRAIILSKNGQVTLETTLDYVKILSQFANLFEYSSVDTTRGRMITLTHRFGPKGSIFYENYMTALFEQIDYFLKIKTHDNSIDFEVIH